MAEGAQTRSDVTALLDRHGVRPRKRLGQHFLVDPNITRKLVRLAGLDPGALVLEVGAGTGTLTRALAEAGCLVRSYEVDEGLAGVLAEALDGVADVELRFEDAMRVDFAKALEGEPWTMVSNLPYQVGTALLLRLLADVPQITRYVVMVQREVADRLTASPGTRTYGLATVLAGLHARISRGFRVPPQVFLPPPSVESAVVVLERASAAPPALTRRTARLAAAAFGGRRKMLRTSLAGEFPDPTAALEAAGIDPTLRAEQLSVDDFVRLAGAGSPSAGDEEVARGR